MSRMHRWIYRAGQLARREPVLRALADLERSQWWSAEQLAEHQRQRIEIVLDTAQRCSFYREAWAGIEIALSRLPLVEKSKLRSVPEAFRNPDFRGPVTRYVTTGSSGVPLRVTRSRFAGALGRACQLRGLRWFGVDLGDRQVRFGGAALENLGRLRARIIDRMMNRVRLDPGDLSEGRLSEYLEIIRRVRPRFLYGYPSTLALFAGFVDRLGVGSDLGLRLVLCSSERLFPHRRERIAQAFGCPVADEYGAAETSIIAMECPQGGLHQSADSLYMEITDENGRPVPAGEEGEVVLTDLHNLAAPLVRYRIGDRGRWVPGRCACGRGLPLMEILAGSSFGLLRLSNGRVLSGATLHFLAESLILRPEVGIAELVLVQRPDGFTARVVRRSADQAVREAEIVGELRETLGPGTNIGLEVVERIARHGGDKYKILVREDGA